jgi:polyphosphate kinase
VTEVLDRHLRERLDEILQVNMDDDELAWELGPDGWARVPVVRGLEMHTYLQQMAERSVK